MSNVTEASPAMIIHVPARRRFLRKTIGTIKVRIETLRVVMTIHVPARITTGIRKTIEVPFVMREIRITSQISLAMTIHVHVGNSKEIRVQSVLWKIIGVQDVMRIIIIGQQNRVVMTIHVPARVTTAEPIPSVRPKTIAV